MAGKSRRNTNGNVRKLPSGKYQARVRNPLTNRLESLGTFKFKADADAELRRSLSRQDEGMWVAPSAGTVTVGEYVEAWIAANPKIRSPRTRQTYELQLSKRIVPYIGAIPMNKLTPAQVRTWYATIVGEHSKITAAKSYRLLRAAYNTALGDELVFRTPCRIAGGGQEHSPERPTATVAEVHAMADAAAPHLRLMVLMGAWLSLRLGELLGLQRADIDLVHRKVTVRRNRQRSGDGEVLLEPKQGSRRTIAIPPPLVAEITRHLDEFSEDDPDGFVFVGAKGDPLCRRQWSREFRKLRTLIDREDLTFHDLRHTGNMLAAATGATTKQLMERMGHSSMQAALRYQHATADADEAIAAALGDLMPPAPVIDLDERRAAG